MAEPDFLPQRIDPDVPVFVISVAAQLAEMHPQTLRGYDRLGLVVPKRARGRGRRYSLRDIANIRATAAEIEHGCSDRSVSEPFQYFD